MRDLMGMMKQAQELQSKMQEFQESVGSIVAEGRSGGGLVVVSVTGKGELRGLKIDPSLFNEDSVEVLEDLIIAAHRDAKEKAEAEVQRKMSEMTAGLPLPPGLKLPF
jgi:DNA-binding YbaB/EbfC family protein